MIREFLARLFRGESAIYQHGQAQRATLAQKAYLEARDSGDTTSKALPCNQTIILPPPPSSKRGCPIVRSGNFSSEF